MMVTSASLPAISGVSFCCKQEELIALDHCSLSKVVQLAKNTDPQQVHHSKRVHLYAPLNMFCLVHIIS